MGSDYSATPNISWEVATGYDLFISLSMIHLPEEANIRPQWAAGIRSRLPLSSRDLLGNLYMIKWLPMEWVHQLEAPKNSETVLATLDALPERERLLQPLSASHMMQPYLPFLLEIAVRGAWSEDDVRHLRRIPGGKKLSKSMAAAVLTVWSQIYTYGSAYLGAIEDFVNVFFADEERRIRPIVSNSLALAQGKAAEMPLVDLLDYLSQGIRYELDEEIEHIVISPSFWTTPLIIDVRLQPRNLLFVYGAKPDDLSLVPGEVVPDELPQALKALSDPTRLKILRRLAEAPAGPSELARFLRLRPPTVTHHLQILRRSRLVRFTLSNGERQLYTIRPEGILAVSQLLHRFLGHDKLIYSGIRGDDG